MALMQASFMSEALERQVSFTAILPVDSFGPPMGKPDAEFKPLRTLYLLHGYSGNAISWLTSYEMGKLSNENHIAIIMPNGENHFYTNDDTFGYGWGKFIGEELVEFTRRMLPLSDKPEDTIIGGFSMGGFGALLNGLTNRETFGKIVSVSAALITVGAEGPGHEEGFFKAIFGDHTKLPGSHHDPMGMATKALEGGPIPDVYMACGTEDFLRELNLGMKKHMEDIHYPKYTFEEDKGGHDMQFSTKYLFRGVARACGREV